MGGSSCAAVVCVGDLHGPMDGVDLGMVGCERMTADLLDVTSHNG